MRVARSVSSCCVLGIFVLSISFVMGSSAQQPTAAQSAPPQRKAPPPPPPAPPAADQELVIPYWTTETGWSCELQLRNNILRQDLTVTPALRLPDGSETPLAPVTIKSQEVKSIDIAAAISAAGAPQLIGTYGSAVLRYHSPSLKALYASVMIRAMGHAIAFHVDGSAEYEGMPTGGREGIWWLPKDSTGDYLILTNQGKNALSLDLSLYDAGGIEYRQKVLLGAHATNRLSVRNLSQTAGLAGSYGGIKVSAASHAGSLDTLHFVFDTGANFSAILKMFDHDPSAKLSERDFAGTKVWTLRAPMLALSNPDPALAFPPDTVLHPQIFIRNTTAKPIDATLRFNWRTGSTTGKAVGPQLHLLPYETRLVDVEALQDGTVLPKQANWTSVTLTSNALPDELMAVAASYDQALKYGAQTPFSDQLSHEWKGGMWEFDPYHDSIITAGNGGTQPTQAAFTIFYNQGTQKYELEQTLQPDEQMWIDVGKLIQLAMPDKDGNVLPRNLSYGSYEFRDLTHPGTGTLFEGKVIYDKTYGHAAYGCATCCGYLSTLLFYDPINVWLPVPQDDGVWGNNPCDVDYVDVSSNFYGNWSSQNTSVVTVDTYGTHTPQNVGSTTSKTFGYLEGTGHYPLCPNKEFIPHGGADIRPTIWLGGPSGTDITNTPQNVVVGQQIVLYAKYTLPSDYTLNSQSWSIPGTIVAGYTASNNGGSVNTNVALNQQSATFYWVFGTSSTVTFTLNFNDNLNNSLTATAQATFNVTPPTGNATATYPTNQQLTIDTLTGCPGTPTSQFLVFGNITGPAPPCPGTYTGQPGIAFSPPTGATPPGNFFFVQLITGDNVYYPSLTCTAVPGLDGAIPYQSKYGSAVNDAPFAPLPYSSITRDFFATMYLMWQSTTASSIAVPISSMQWNFQSSSTLTNGVWSTPTGGGGGGLFNAATTLSDYPTWTGLAIPDNNNCH